MSQLTPLAVLALLALVVGAFADSEPYMSHDWPQWRGIHRDGVSGETDLLERWSEAGPEVVWSASAGAGFSSVTVAGGQAFTLGDQGDAQFLLSLNAMTGKERWRRKLGATFSSSYGDGPRSTPLVDADLVFAVSAEGRLLAAHRETGETEWQHDLVAEFGAELPAYGFSSSPLLIDDRLILEVGGKDATFMAFARDSGRVIWSSQTDRSAYSSPIAATLDGVLQVVFWSGSGLHSVSPQDGRLLWKFGSETLCSVTGIPLNTGTPIFLAPDRFYIASGSGAKMLRVVRSEEEWRPELVWETEKMRSDVSSAVVMGSSIYGFHRGILQAIDAETGAVQWQTRGFARGSLIAAGDKLIVFGESGNLALAEASPSGFQQLASAQVLEGRNWTAPSLANGYLYLRNHEQLVALNLRRH